VGVSLRTAPFSGVDILAVAWLHARELRTGDSRVIVNNVIAIFLIYINVFPCLLRQKKVMASLRPPPLC
jgi:hypothetical protein